MRHGLLFLMLRGKEWSGRVDPSFLLATVRMLRCIGSLILIPKRSYFDGMFSLMSAFL